MFGVQMLLDIQKHRGTLIISSTQIFNLTTHMEIVVGHLKNTGGTTLSCLLDILYLVVKGDSITAVNKCVLDVRLLK